MRFGLIGASYSLDSMVADCQRTMNFYPEPIESGNARSQLRLVPTPGLKTFATLPGNAVRGLYELNGRLFAVDDMAFYEVASDGSYSSKGAIAAGTSPVSMAASSIQIAVVSSGELYVYTLATDVLSHVLTLTANPTMVEYADGYHIVLLENSSRFQISGLLDALTWDPADIAQVSVFADNVLSFIVDHRELWLLGRKKSQVYYDSGNADFPWEPRADGFIEQGILAPRSLVRLDNTVFWIGGDERGGPIAWRAAGFLPQRVSNHAVEIEWAGYPDPTDFIGYTYVDRGHAFWVLYSPSGNKTWVYDARTNLWSERGNWRPIASAYEAHRSQCHAYCFGKHLVGDRSSGKIYEMASSIRDDNGTAIRRMRRSPVVSNEWKWIYYNQLLLDMETGIGLGGDPTAVGADPQVAIRWSNDFGKTWGNEHLVSAGRIGTYQTRVHLHQLGRARGRVFEIVVTDPVPWNIVEGYVEADGGEED